MTASVQLVVAVVLLCGGAPRAAAQAARPGEYRSIAPGRLRPAFVAGVPDSGLRVGAFLLAARPVTNASFLRFVMANPHWRRSRVSRLAADASYLRHWESDTRLGARAAPTDPVVNVSWFAATAYATWVGARLPSTAEWELAASRFRRTLGDAPDRLSQQVMAWYMLSASDAAALDSLRQVSDDGVEGLHRVPWEWVDDFNSVITSGESRGDSGPDDGLFCAGGAALSADPANYAAFMRYAVRGSLRGSYALATLGFRLARDPTPTVRRIR